MHWASAPNLIDDYDPDDLNQYDEITPSGSSAITLDHDGNGNVAEDQHGYDYTFDAENRLQTVKDGAATLLSNYHYADGSVRANAGSAHYYAGGQEIGDHLGLAGVERRDQAALCSAAGQLTEV